MGHFRRLAAPAAVLALCACLSLYGLDRPKLWIDEAETALLARSILVHGVPKARVGNDLISQEVGREFGPDLVWRWTPWLDKYVAAGSFALFGEKTWAARLPFALLGLVTVASMWALGFGLFADRRIALMAMAFLATSVPFLLHVRQCRYYVLAMLGTLWAVHFTVATVRRGGWRAPLGLAAAMTLVFHANYLTFTALSIGLAASVWVLGVSRIALVRLAAAAAGAALVNGPWLFLLDVGGKSDLVAKFHPDFVIEYLTLANHYDFPLGAVLAVGALAALTRRWRELRAEWRLPVFLALLALCYIPVICFAPLRYFRYMANLLPVFAVLLAWLSVRAFDMQRVAGAAFGVLLLLTGVFGEISALPTRYAGPGDTRRTRAVFDWAFPLGNLVAELDHPFEGSMGRVTEYIAANGRPGDRVFVSYGDLVARFYLKGFEIRGGQSGESLEGWGPPEWIFTRRFFRFIGPKVRGSDAEAITSWLAHSIPWDQYEGIELLVPDLAWESIPEPQWHWFRPPLEGEMVLISRRRAGDSLE